MNTVAWLIIGCEIAFWVVIALGLFTRYILQYPKLGLILLAMTPVVDLVLLIVTGIDMYRGATATFAHALAGVYIGVSIGFGKRMIAWADERFRYYILKQGNKPIKLYGTEYAAHYLKSWYAHILSFAIGAGLLGLITYWIASPERTEALTNMIRIWSVVLVIDLFIAISNFVWPKKRKSS